MITAGPIRWLEHALALVYPNVCQICREEPASAGEGYVCSTCWKGVRFVRSPLCDRCGLPFDGEVSTRFECANCRELDLHFDAARSAVLARGVVLDVIHRYKYRSALWFERFLADLLIRQAAPMLNRQEWDWIVPVPLHRVREREREFNQARQLAMYLARATGIPLRTDLLTRIRATRTQTTLSRRERARNMNRAFQLRGKPALGNTRCVIVDDVFTTGATTSACARALKAAGATKVCVWTVARGV